MMNAPVAIKADHAVARVEREVIQLFVHLSDLIGLPRSLGELYGCLFIASEPLTMSDLMRRLHLSKGATSQGLRLLKALGAVSTVYVPGTRRDHFTAELELRRLVAGFLREKVTEHFQNVDERLQRIRALVEGLDPVARGEVVKQVERLANWHQRARRVMPDLLRMLEQ